MEFKAFIRQNFWAILTGFTLVVSNYTILTQRLETLEKRVADHEQQLQALTNIQTMAYQLQVIESNIANLSMKVDASERNLQDFYKNDWVKVERILATIGASSYNQPAHSIRKVN